MKIADLNNITPSKQALDALKRTNVAFIMIAGNTILPFRGFDECRAYAQGVSDTKGRIAPISINEGIHYLMMQGYALMIINDDLYYRDFNLYNTENIDDDFLDYLDNDE